MERDLYASDKETALILYHWFHYQPFGKNTLSSFPAQYRNVVTNNSLDIVEVHLVFFQKVPNNY